METIKIATAQFEHRSDDKNYNLSIIKKLAQQASTAGANVIAFHECCITGYTFARELSKAQMLELAEELPDSPSVEALRQIAAEFEITILAGLFEKDAEDNLYKPYICVDKTGLVASHRKLHPFINPHLTPGNSYTVFDLYGWKCG